MGEQELPKDPLVGTCGICCSLCPPFRMGECPGCPELVNCKIRQCGETKGSRYCFLCEEFPCRLFEEGFDWDLNEFPVFKRVNYGTVRWRPYSIEYIRFFKVLKENADK